MGPNLLFRIVLLCLLQPLFFQNFLMAPPDRSSLVDLLRDALQEVLFQRPDDPVKFLKQYFVDLKKNVDG